MDTDTCDWCGETFSPESGGGYIEGIPCCDDCWDEAVEEMEVEELAA